MKLFRLKEKQVSDHELVKGCIAGERNMQRLLYDRFSAPMNKICLRYAQTSFEAEDLLHEAFMKVFLQLDTFKHECPLEGWIRRIVVNTAISGYRKQSRRNELVEIEQKESLDDLDVAIEEHDGEYLMEMIRRLPDKYRIVLNLHAVEGYSYKEVSEMLQQPEATTRSQYLRARLQLQEMITKENQYHEQGRN